MRTTAAFSLIAIIAVSSTVHAEAKPAQIICDISARDLKTVTGFKAPIDSETGIASLDLSDKLGGTVTAQIEVKDFNQISISGMDIKTMTAYGVGAQTGSGILMVQSLSEGIVLSVICRTE